MTVTHGRYWETGFPFRSDFSVLSVFYRFDYIKIPISFFVVISFLLCFEWSQMKYHVYEQRKTYNEHKNKQQQKPHLLFFLVWGTDDGHWFMLRACGLRLRPSATGFACVCVCVCVCVGDRWNNHECAMQRDTPPP